MLPIIYILIVFFIILIIYQLLLANYVIEGFKKHSYNKRDSYNKKDSCNQGYLCKKLAKANVVNNITDLSNNVASLQKQVNSLIQANKDYTANMTANTTNTNS
jgi:hypothetical protein